MRIEFPGACYHLINRGNYQQDLFATEGAAKAFLRTLEEAAERFSWRVHAYVVMRNHFHLAVELIPPYFRSPSRASRLRVTTVRIDPADPLRPIACELCMGRPAALRVLLRRAKRVK